MSNLHYAQRGWRQAGPRDIELAAALIDWALEENFPIDLAIKYLIQLITIALAAGRHPDALPANAQPDNVARQALMRFGFTRAEAVSRAGELRSKPYTDDDFPQPGEDSSENFRLLSATDDYKDYHRPLGIQRMLDNLQSIAGLLTDRNLAAELDAWLEVLPELDPVPITPVELPSTPADGGS